MPGSLPLRPRVTHLEFEICRLAARPLPSSRALRRLEELLAAPFDGDRLVALATHHEVHLLLLRALRRAGIDGHETWLEALDGACRASLAKILLLESKLGTILGVLASGGVRALALKGPLFARDVYGASDLRTAGDLDLWIRREDAPRAVRILEAEGYRVCLPLRDGEILRYLPFDKALDLVDTREPVPVFVDLHWNVASAEQMVDADLDGIWERAHSGREPAGLSPEDLTILLALHGYNHDWDRLKLLCDIDGLVCRHGDGMEWEAMARRARTWGVADILERALRLTAAILGTRVPPEAAGCLSVGYWRSDPLADPDAFLAAAAARDSEPSSAAAWVTRVRGRHGAMNKARQILASFRPKSADYLALRHSNGNRWMAWLVRPVRVAGKVAGQALGPRRRPDSSNPK